MKKGIDPKVAEFLDKLKAAGLPASQHRELLVVSDRLTNILLVLGMNGIPSVTTDLRTETGKQPLVIIEREIELSKEAKQIITDICKAFVIIAVGDEVFESSDAYSGHLTYVMRKLPNAVLIHIEMPFWDACVTSLGNRTMMKFLDIVSS